MTMGYEYEDREIVIRHIVGSTLPLVLARDIEPIKEVCSMCPISRRYSRKT
ncbi:hypothetical protein PAAL109150_06945 [Paenibacillus alkaliterrae]